MIAAHTNLKALKRSYARPKAGDIFVMQLPDDEYLFGRVIVADAPRGRGPMPGANLIYIYNQRSATAQPVASDLRPGKLLIPPLWTNRLAWTKGYFQTIESRLLEKSDVLRQHCFFRASASPTKPGTFVDETGRLMSHQTQPCGDWALFSYRWIDDHVSDAIGIPRVPEE